MDIPVGLVIRVDHLALHYNEELWGPIDPKEFYPLRYDQHRLFIDAYLHLKLKFNDDLSFKFILLNYKHDSFKRNE